MEQPDQLHDCYQIPMIQYINRGDLDQAIDAFYTLPFSAPRKGAHNFSNGFGLLVFRISTVQHRNPTRE